MTEITDLSTTDSSNTSISGESLDGAIANMGRMDNTLQATMGMLARSIRSNIMRWIDGTDSTKRVALDLSGITAGQTRTWTAPDKSGTLAMTSDIGTSNLALAASVAGNALTIAIKGFDGNDPSASNVVSVPFRSATAGSGDIDVLNITSATSLVISSGSTLGSTNGVAATYVVVGFNDAGTFRLGLINANGTVVPDGIASSSAEGGAGAADAAKVFYTGTAVTSKAYTVLGYLVATEATAGTWATAPSTVQTGPSAPTALAILPFTKAFVSTQQAFVTSGTVTIAHGLGVAPKLVTAEVVCLTGEGGYSAGAVIEIATTQQSTSSADNYGAAFVKDSTNVQVVFGSGGTFVIMSASTFSGLAITPANWRLVVRAYA